MSVKRVDSPVRRSGGNAGAANLQKGRTRGSANVRTSRLVDEIMKDEDRLSPAEFMISVLNGDPIRYPQSVDEDGVVRYATHLPDFEDMQWAAEKCAPFIHARKQAIQAESDDGPLVVQIIKYADSTRVNGKDRTTEQLESETISAEAVGSA